jgi:hypothetical protein
MAAWASSAKSPVWTRRPSRAAETNWSATWPSGPGTGFAYPEAVGLRWEKETEQALLEEVRPETAGHPVTGQRWTGRSLSRLQRALQQRGHGLSHESIRSLLYKHRIRPRCHVKRLVPKPHPERDRQFGYLTRLRRRFEARGWPVLSVDTKKKELIGRFAQPGTQWREHAEAVFMHDFPSDAEGRAVPYGIYDPRCRQGAVYVGQSADTPQFAVDALVWWWQRWGRARYPGARHLLILSDAGGSDGCRPRNWKRQVQERVADAPGVTVTVCHDPVGASKWNPIEHRLFSQISCSFRGVPFLYFEVLMKLIQETTTESGLHVEVTRVQKHYPKGIKVSDATMRRLRIKAHTTCPRRNYTIRPRKTGSSF